MIYQISKQALTLSMSISFRFIQPYLGSISGMTGTIKGFVTYDHVGDKQAAAIEYQRMLSALPEDEKISVDPDVENAEFIILHALDGSRHFISPLWISAHSLLTDGYTINVTLPSTATLAMARRILKDYGLFVPDSDSENKRFVVVANRPNYASNVEAILKAEGIDNVTAVDL